MLFFFFFFFFFFLVLLVVGASVCGGNLLSCLVAVFFPHSVYCLHQVLFSYFLPKISSFHKFLVADVLLSKQMQPIWFSFRTALVGFKLHLDFIVFPPPSAAKSFEENGFQFSL